MLTRQTLTPYLQSLIDLYCHFPPKSATEIHDAVQRVKNEFDRHSDHCRNIKTLILNDICLPMCIGSHWEAATRVMSASESMLSGIPYTFDRSMRIVAAFPTEHVCLFLRRSSRFSVEACNLLERILLRSYDETSPFDSNSRRILAGNLKEVPLRYVSPRLLNILLRHAIESGNIEDLNWVFGQRWPRIPRIENIVSLTGAETAIRSAILNKIQLYTSEVSEHIEKILERHPEKYNSTMLMAQEYDCMKKITGSSVYYDASLRYALKKQTSSRAYCVFHSSVSAGSQLAPLSLCDLVSGMICDGRWQRATRVLCSYADVVPQIPLKMFSRIVKLFIRMGKHSVAYQLLQNHSPLITDDFALANLLYFLSKDGEWEMLISIYDKLQPRSQSGTQFVVSSSNTTWNQRTALASASVGYENILNGFSPRQWLAAIATYELMIDRSLLINYKILTKLLLVCCKANRWEPALALYHKVHNVHRSHRSIDLYAGYMGNLHRCLYMNGKWELSAALLGHSVVYPTEMASNYSLASIVENAPEKWELSLSVIRQMLHASQKLSCVSIGVIRDVQRRSSGSFHGDVYLKVLSVLTRDSQEISSRSCE